MDSLTALLEHSGLLEHADTLIGRALAVCVVLALAWLANFLAKKPLMVVLKSLTSKTPTTWDDSLLRRKVLHRLAHLVPAFVVYLLTPYALSGFPGLIGFVNTAVVIYSLIMGMLVVDALLNAFLEIYAQYEISKEMHLKGVVQMLKVVIYIVAGIVLISIMVGQTPLYILSGLGALTAVLMLIFKDAILGFVAGIQLTANKMVALGDWVEMSSYGADGDVIDVALTTVKVQNWDKTITTIPTYALITESFRNWRGMSESGGRRIKRSLVIDMNTIRFCDEEMLARFSKIQYINEYLVKKRDEISAYNREHAVDEASRVNGRRLTNVGTFRAYIGSYLHHHPMVNLDMTFLVRQLEPGPHGLPIEIYVFCKDKVWAHYEGIQADIFDHILAVVPEFDLRVFQFPSGSDVKGLVSL